jgi:hypothetical protein
LLPPIESRASLERKSTSYLRARVRASGQSPARRPDAVKWSAHAARPMVPNLSDSVTALAPQRQRSLSINRLTPRSLANEASIKALKARSVAALGAKNYAGAIEHLTAWIALDPAADAFRLRAKANHKAGAFVPALRDAREAADLHPSAANMELLGELTASAGTLHDASSALQQAMAVEPFCRAEALYAGVLSGIRSQRQYFATRHRRVPRVFDTSVELSDPARDVVGHMMLTRPTPGPTAVLASATYRSITISWALPDDDGGDEIYESIVESSFYDVAWSNADGKLFDGMREFESWHRGRTANVRTASWDMLEPDNTYCFRVRCVNSIGISDPSPELTVRTLLPAERTDEGMELPPSWLRSDYSDLVRDQVAERKLIDGATVLVELELVLADLAEEIHVAYKLFCMIGSKDVTALAMMQRQQFNDLVKAAELVDKHALNETQIDLVFLRSNMDFRTAGGGSAKAVDEDGGARTATPASRPRALRIARARSPPLETRLSALGRTHRRGAEPAPPCFHPALHPSRRTPSHSAQALAR